MFTTSRTLLTVGALLIVLHSPAAGLEPATDAIFPESTLAYLQVKSFPDLEEAWERTAFARLFDDPAMQPFMDDIEAQINAKREEEASRLGITRDDIEGLASGEIGLAILRTADGKISLASIVDVAGNEARARDVLEKVSSSLVQQRGVRRDTQVGNVRLTVFDLPPKTGSHRRRQAAFFLDGAVLGAFDNAAVAADIIGRMNNPRGGLRDVEAYQAVFKRCEADASNLAPLARFFVDPLPLAIAVRASREDPSPRGDTDILKMLENQGFGAVRGIGGHLNLNVDNRDVVYRVAFYAPPPYKLAMRMLGFPNSSEYQAPDWVPANVSSCVMFNWDMQNAFEHFGTMFDELFGEGETGVFEEVLEGIHLDEEGPQIDVRKELVAYLGTRATVISDNKLPVDVDSQRKLFAAELKDPVKFADSLRRAMEGDPNVEIHEINGTYVYEILPIEEDEFDFEVEEPDRPFRRRVTPRREEVAARPKEKQDEDAPPNSAVAVVHGQLMIATHLEYIKDMLEKPETQLKDDPVYNETMREFAALRPDAVAFLGFSRLAEEARVPYELFRTGRFQENQRLLARTMRDLLSEEQESEQRKPRYDGSKLPDFDLVARYLGYGASYARSEDNGWFLFGCLTGKTPAEAQAAEDQPAFEGARSPSSKGAR